ncbi:UNVERIFIED_CONTAM: hypothetical protein K2H54_062488 [Gekko kuhli]
MENKQNKFCSLLFLPEDPFTAFHLDKTLVRKFMKPLLIGELAEDQPSFEPSKNKLLVEDFRQLRATVEKMGLLNPNRLFFFLYLIHILLLDVAAWLNLWYFGPSFVPFLVSGLLLGTVQAQAGWLQHDLGHLSVFGKSKWNHWVHKFVIGHLKGAPASWWNHWHFQHHAKPNCFRKDPDLNMHPLLFALGKKLSVEVECRYLQNFSVAGEKEKWHPENKSLHCQSRKRGKWEVAAQLVGPPALVPFYLQWYIFYFVVQRKQWVLGMKKKKFMPYNHQHKYFFILGPPALVPFYLQWYIFYFVVQRKQWVDLAWMVTFYIRFFLTYSFLLELKSLFALFFMLRFIESHWFVWVTQMNHIPMNIDYDKNVEWFSTQDLLSKDLWLQVCLGRDEFSHHLQATCNVHPSFFNDWFSGHLNFQIEHHLFPTMPRHNFWKVTPLVKSMCAKYGIEYQSKPLLTAFADIVYSLKDSGELWLDAYMHN